MYDKQTNKQKSSNVPTAKYSVPKALKQPIITGK